VIHFLAVPSKAPATRSPALPIHFPRPGDAVEAARAYQSLNTDTLIAPHPGDGMVATICNLHLILSFPNSSYI
jgi:hypothetical protein